MIVLYIEVEVNSDTIVLDVEVKFVAPANDMSGSLDMPGTLGFSGFAFTF